ncbi:MAG: hypothetical protein K0S78_5772 [Thermomicrobiales bacterium]|jgi:hypothetical protein|nr:hypothetical protein [Thermomicrobiales bacterium]
MRQHSFDAFTRRAGEAMSRRRLLAGLGSGLLALLASAAIDDAAAARKQRRKKKNKKVRCKRLGDGCTPGGKRKCCGRLICSATGPDEDGPVRCCKEPGERCTKFDDCCSLFCFQEECLDT